MPRYYIKDPERGEMEIGGAVPDPSQVGQIRTVPRQPTESPSTISTTYGLRSEYGDFQTELIKELDSMEAMSSAMLMADKGNAAGDPDLTAYATANHQLRSQEILGYKRQVESTYDIIHRRHEYNKHEKQNLFQQAKAKIRRPIATPGRVPGLTPAAAGRPASAAERTAIATGRASIDALDNLKALFDSVQTQVGPIAGRISPIAGLMGLTSDEQEDFMAATSAFKNQIIKEITGAQMSEVEAQRIMKQVPDITDPPARWEAKWRQSKKNLELLQKRRMEILQQSGVRAPMPARQTAIPAEMQNMPNKQFIKTATNPQTGEKVGFDGEKWIPIQ